MRKYPHYGTANDNSFIGDIVRFIDQHAHLKPFEKDLLVNRITERYTGDSVEVKIAHLAMGIAVPEMFATKFADELDAIPLGTAQEERQRAKLWMEDAGRYARNEAYWREKRAYPAEECVRMLVDEIAAQGGCKEPLTEKCHKLIGHIRRWGRPENPEQYHEVPTESAKIDDLKWLDNVVPRTASVSKPFAEQRFNVEQKFDKNFNPDLVASASKPAISPVVNRAKRLIQSWLDKQGHDRCWYYPDIFRELADLFGLKPTVDPQLPSAEAFQSGCQRYQLEQYGKAAASTVVTDADVQTLIVAYKSLTVRTNSELWPKITALIDKMEDAIAENAKVGKPEGVWVSRERLDQLEHAEDNLRVLKEHEAQSRSMSFAELLDVHQRGAASLQHIGYLFLAAMREDKCFAIKMGPTVEISGSTGTGGPTLREPLEGNTCEHGGDHPAPPNKRFCSDVCSRCDETEHDAEKQGCAGICGVREQELQLKIAQGANGDYFVQHKGGLWRIEANGVIGAGVDAWRSFCNVLAELGTPQGGAAAGNESGEPSLVVLDAARFQELNEAEDHLVALKAAGVDNWEGYVGPNGFKDE